MIKKLLVDVINGTSHSVNFLLENDVSRTLSQSGIIDIPIKMLNSIPEIQGNKLFAINHSCVLDGPVSSKVIGEHFYFLVGKQSLDLIDRIFFLLNGVVYVDRKSKKNKKKT